MDSKRRNPKFDDSCSANETLRNSNTLICAITRPACMRDGSASQSAPLTNRYSVQSIPASYRHDSFTSNGGSERGTLRPSPSASDLANSPFDGMTEHLFSTYNRNRMREIDPRLEYDRNSIKYIKDLGTGAFGQVFQAEVVDKNNERVMQVAVKMMKDGRASDLKKAFQNEALLLANFSHPNIVKLRGVCTKGTPFCMLMDYMKHGDLHRYLALSTGNADGMKRPLSVTDLLMISQQVASGMSYISEKNYIHRDLATRNCLVGENLVVKITDFGLSVQLRDNNDYTILEPRDGVVPMRWMSPEALTIGRYSRHSDVWSFGILLWEVFTYAMQPYYG